MAQRVELLAQLHEALCHLGVHLVDAAAADRIVRLLLDQQPPGVRQRRRQCRTCTGRRQLRPQWFAFAQQAVLELLVHLLQGASRAQHIGQHESLGVVAQLSVQGLARAGCGQRRIHMLYECGQTQVELGLFRVELRQPPGQFSVGCQVVTAMRQQQRCVAARGAPRGDALQQRGQRRGAVGAMQRVQAVALGQEHRAGHRAVGRVPVEAVVHGIGAAPQHGAVDAELRQHLRHLRHMAKGVGQVAHALRSREGGRIGMAEFQVAQQRFAADQELVR